MMRFIGEAKLRFDKLIIATLAIAQLVERWTVVLIRGMHQSLVRFQFARLEKHFLGLLFVFLLSLDNIFCVRLAHTVRGLGPKYCVTGPKLVQCLHRATAKNLPIFGTVFSPVLCGRSFQVKYLQHTHQEPMAAISNHLKAISAFIWQ